MLREMTSSAFAHSFKRFAQCAVVGLALAGLAACGGGGSSTPAATAPTTPTPTPDIPITPAPTDQPAPTADQLEAAVVIAAGETVDGTLESADDVKYYRLDVAETSVVELTIDAEAGTEVALLDSSGAVVLAHAVTASKATLRHTVVKGVYHVRALAKRINESRPFRLVNQVTKVSKYAGLVINIITLSPKFDIPLGSVGEINIDLRGIFDSSQPLKYSIGGEFGVGSLGTLSGRFERDQLRLSPTSDAVPTTLRLIVKATASEVDNIPGASVPIEITLFGIMVKPSHRTGVIEFIDPRETYTSQNLGDYFLYPEGAQISFNLTETRRLPSESDWTRRITNGRLVVSTTSVRNGDLIGITVTATDPLGRTADLLVTVTVQYSPTVKPEYQYGVRGDIAPGETYTSENLGDYFDYPEGAQISFTLVAGRPEPNRTGWTHGIENGRLVVSGASDMDPGDYIPLVVYATVDPAGPENAELSFVVMVEEVPPISLSDVPCDREEIVETDETECIHDESIALGGTYTSRNVEDYFYPAGTQTRFATQAATGTPRVEGWTHRIVDRKLVVTVPSNPDADRTPRDNLRIYLSAEDPDGASARRLFSFTIAPEEMQQPTPDPMQQPTPSPGGGAMCPLIVEAYRSRIRDGSISRDDAIQACRIVQRGVGSGVHCCDGI